MGILRSGWPWINPYGLDGTLWGLRAQRQKIPTIQCCQPVQKICPDISAFPVLDNRHCADIAPFAKSVNLKFRKGWRVLLSQSEAEDMYCNQTDSAILKLSFVKASMESMEQIYCITKQTLCGDYSLMSWHGLCPIYSRFVANRNLAPIRAFRVCFVQTFTQTFRIWLRFCTDTWTKNRRLAALPLISPLVYINIINSLQAPRASISCIQNI